MFKIYNWWHKKKFLADQITENIIESDTDTGEFIDSLAGGVTWFSEQPPSPNDGDAYYDKSDQKILVYNSSDKQWYEVGGAI